MKIRTIGFLAMVLTSASPVLAQQLPATLPPAAPTVTPPASSALPAVPPAPAAPLAAVPAVASPAPALSAVTTPTYAPPTLLPNFHLGAPPGVSGQLWANTDYLLWWIKGSPAPPLAVSGPAHTGGAVTLAPSPTTPGFIGFETVAVTSTPVNLATANKVLLGNNLDTDVRSGGRFTLGYWLDPGQTLGIEASYFDLGPQTSHLQEKSTTVPGLSIPYVNALTGQETGYAIGQPTTVTNFSEKYINTTPGVFVHLYTTTTTDVYRGLVAINNQSQLQGGETNAIWKLWGGPGSRLELLAGFRFAELDERLGINSGVIQNHTSMTNFEPALGIPGNPDTFTNFTAITSRSDEFNTHNNFYGGQVGARGEYNWGALSVLGGAKIGVGSMHESVDIEGVTGITQTTTATPTTNFSLAGIPLVRSSGAPAVTSTTTTSSLGGLFAQPTNMGHYSRDVLVILPEVNLGLGYQINSQVRATIGYSFLYISDVARPGNQIDRGINPSLLSPSPTLGPPSSPTLFQIKGSDFWAQGLNFGLAFKF